MPSNQPALLISGRTKARKAQKTRPVKPRKSSEVEYRAALLRMARLLKQQTEQIGLMVTEGESVMDVTRALRSSLRQTQALYDSAAEDLSSSFVSGISADNKAKIEQLLKSAMGVDLVRVLDTPEIKPALDLAIAENVSLIRSVPEQHFARVGQAVLKNYRGEKLAAGSLVKELKLIDGISDRRARFIARDQNSKILSSVNEIRQKNVGVKRYLWRNAGDEKVTGYPGGPNQPSAAHGDHYAREGKEYSWDKPPADGHPGHAPGCRCYPEAIIDLEEVEANAVRA